MRKYTNICRFKTSRYFSKVFRIAIRVCKHVLIFFFEYNFPLVSENICLINYSISARAKIFIQNSRLAPCTQNTNISSQFSLPSHLFFSQNEKSLCTFLTHIAHFQGPFDVPFDKGPPYLQKRLEFNVSSFFFGPSSRKASKGCAKPFFPTKI